MTTARAPRFARDQRPAQVPIWLESLAGLDWLGLRLSPVYFGGGVPRGDGAPVVVVPGFLGTDCYLQEMYWWLRRLGYRPYMSRIGRNAECLDLLAGRLLATIERAHDETGRRVHLIGHSLGGMLSRSAAIRRPALVASVATLGSPFRGVRSHPLVLRMSDRVRARVRRRGQAADATGPPERPECYTGHCGCDTVTALQRELPSSVASLAVYTRTDGIVDWRFCISDDPATNREVTGTHIGLAFNPQVYRHLGRHLGAAGAARQSPAAPA